MAMTRFRWAPAFAAALALAAVSCGGVGYTPEETPRTEEPETPVTPETPPVPQTPGKEEPAANAITVPLDGNTWRSAGGNITVPSDSTQDAVVSNDAGLGNWKNTADAFSVYFRPQSAGSLRLFLQYRPITASQIRVSFTDLETDTPLGADSLVMLSGNAAGGIATEHLGSITIAGAGYIRVDFRGVTDTGGAAYATPIALLADGAASAGLVCVATNEGAMYYWGRRGPSVHLGYDFSGAANVEYFYNEVRVPAGFDPVGSYFMVCGSGQGYFGIQVNSTTERRVLFSIWSTYVTDDPSSIPEDEKIILDKKGEGVQVGEFGNEGSGGQSYLIYPWKTEVTYRFLKRVRPSSGNYTEYSAWFYDPQSPQWRLIARFRRPKTSTYYSGPYSFVENFGPDYGNLTRKARFLSQWAYNGAWHEITRAQFTVDATGRGGHRLDYRGGLESGVFFLQNGGFFNTYTTPNTYFTRSANHSPPSIDFASLE